MFILMIDCSLALGWFLYIIDISIELSQLGSVGSKFEKNKHNLFFVFLMQRNVWCIFPFYFTVLHCQPPLRLLKHFSLLNLSPPFAAHWTVKRWPCCGAVLYSPSDALMFQHCQIALSPVLFYLDHWIVCTVVLCSSVDAFDRERRINGGLVNLKCSLYQSFLFHHNFCYHLSSLCPRSVPVSQWATHFHFSLSLDRRFSI